MADLGHIRLVQTEARGQREQLAKQLADVADTLAAERKRFAALQAAAASDEAAAASATILDLVEQRATAARAIAELQERMRVDLDALLGATLELEGDVPLVLLPVRVEARSTADGATLRVRIFHDALHAETLDEGVSETERAAGIAYWTAVWDSDDTSAPWPQLVAATGRRRAPWIAEALRPKNLNARPAAPPDFPETAPRTARPAMARTLPDRFFVRIEQDGAPPSTFAGSAIADELPVGLPDRDEFTALQLAGQDLPPVDESLRWLIDYAEAERVGMAVTVQLPLPGRPVRRLMVYGVRAALDRIASSARLDRLIRSHRFTDGAEFVAQGTPTNNTESVRTDWSKRTPPGPPTLDPAAGLDPATNAAVTAAALGVDIGLLTAIPGAARREQAHAAAFNTALWTTTWGDAIEHLTPAGRANGDQRLDSPSLDAVRDHWVDHVRGRGPLPVLRLGRQPYGLLPVVATDASWRPLRGGFIENRLVPFIDQQIRWLWNDAQAAAVTVMNRPLDDALPEILGTDAVLRGLRVRTALSPDPMVTGAMALTLPDLGSMTSGQQVTRALLILSGVADDALDDHDLLGTKTRTLALPLVHESDLQFIGGLLQPNPPPMRHQSVLQVLIAHADAVDRHARATVAPPEMHGILREAIASNQAELDGDLLLRALDVVLLDEAFGDDVVAAAAEHVHERVGRLDKRVIADWYPIPALAPGTTVQQVAGMEPRVDRLRGAVGMQAVGEIFHRSRWSAAVRAALEVIAKIESIEERRLLLSETLDCCSHRLDAWLTSVAARRLGDLRARGAAGVFLGAYGWLENIELRNPLAVGQIDDRDVLHDGADGGYIHAPGLTHAATAAILRSGRLTHRRGDPNSEALDIDLSSTRTRDALALLDGMRRGQSLGALLGYRLERRLHEQSGGLLELDRFIYVLRTLAPLRGGKLTEPGQTVQESVAASDVVDGLRLMAIPPATIAQKLVDGPTDTRYIVPPDRWMPPRPGESEAVLAAIEELERTHDAVADLLLAESVYQLASGNPARAAAVLDVLGAGEAVPPEPEVVRTPRSGVPIQHRVAILVPDPLPEVLGAWDTTNPRARAEPRLEAWAQGALGDPAAMAVAGDRAVTLAGAHLCALDVLYDADGDSVGASTLAARLRRLLGDLGEDLSPLAPLWELAGMLRAVVLGGRPLDVADVGRPIEEGAKGRVPDVDELLARATTAVNGLKAAAAGADPLPDLARFGVRPPPSRNTLELTTDEQNAAREALISAAETRIATAEDLLARARRPAPLATVVELASQALATVFGGGFVVMPRLLPPPAGEADLWLGAVGPTGVKARPGADIRPWLARAGALRAGTSAFGETLLVREAFGLRPHLRVVQSPAGAYATWAGLPFGAGAPPMVPLACMVAEVARFSAGEPEPPLTQAIAGIVIDEWIEVAPRRLERGDPKDRGAEPQLVDVTTTGVAINANAPGARPPQAILIALSPDGGGWSDDRLAHLLTETLALARMRTLTLQQIPYIGRYLPALYFRDWSLQGEPVIDWVKVATEFNVNDTLKFLAVD